MMPDADPIIDRSLAQKADRLEAMRLELLALGFSIVKTSWLEFLTTFHRQASLARRPYRRKKAAGEPV